MTSDSVTWIALFLFAGGMAYAGVRDMATMIIPNRLVLLLAGAYMILAPLAGIGLEGMLHAAAAAAMVLAGSLILFAFGWIGGGDAKLAPVAVLWLGADQALAYLLYVSLGGALLTLTLLQLRRMPLPAFLQRMEWPSRLHASTTGIPYGVALACAALLLLPESSWFAGIL